MGNSDSISLDLQTLQTPAVLIWRNFVGGKEKESLRNSISFSIFFFLTFHLSHLFSCFFCL